MSKDAVLSRMDVLLEIICKLAKGQAQKLFNHALVIHPVETYPRQRRAAAFLDR
jgi:hypothetical protein